MTVITRAAQSLEYVEASVAATDRETGEVVDPTGDAVALAFVDENVGLTDDADFIAAAWITNVADVANPVYIAQLLVGPGAAYEPVAGARQTIYVKITDSPEAPQIRAGGYHWT